MTDDRGFRIPEFGRFQPKEQRRPVLHQREAVNGRRRKLIEDATYGMLWLLVLKLIQAVLDAPNLRAGVGQLLVASPVVEIRGTGKASVHPHIHAKLKAVSSDVHLLVILVAVHPHLGFHTR